MGKYEAHGIPKVNRIDESYELNLISGHGQTPGLRAPGEKTTVSLGLMVLMGSERGSEEVRLLAGGSNTALRRSRALI